MGSPSVVKADVVRLVQRGNWAMAVLERAQPPGVEKVTGTILVTACVHEGGRYCFTGEYKHHPKYGRSLEAQEVVPDVDASEAGLSVFMAREYKGCGKKTAAKVVAWYEARDQLERLRSLLVEKPWELVECPAVKGAFKESIEASREQGVELAVLRLFAVNLSGVGGIPMGLSSRLAHESLARLSIEEAAKSDRQQVAEAAWQLFAGDPYSPIQRTRGYGFSFADRIGMWLKVSPAHPVRLAALGEYVLMTACEQEGHSYLTDDEFRERIEVFERRYNREVDYLRIVECITQYRFPVVAVGAGGGGQKIYPLKLLENERALARRIARMLLPQRPLMQPDEAEEALAVAQQRVGLVLSKEQMTALYRMLTSPLRLHTLTAGPGCGKTASIEVFATALRGESIAFAAPTGKAAKKLSERVQGRGFIATTLHRLMEPYVDEHGQLAFARCEDDPITADVIVIDEGSMCDLEMTRKVFDAVRAGSHVILLGDVDQIPSVGPGNVLADILKLPGDHHRLNEVFRNEGGILELVREVREGQFPREAPGPDVSLPGDPGLAASGFGRIEQLPDGSMEVIEGPVMAMYLQALQQHPIDEVGLLIPRRKGQSNAPGWNITYINKLLQQRLNPEGMDVGATGLRVGDRIILRRNLSLPAAGGTDAVEVVVNGDTGWIDQCTPKSGGGVEDVLVQLDDGRRVSVPEALLTAVHLGYAITVHSSQGSEYNVVVIVAQEGMPLFANRSLLYTAVSRAKQELSVFGSYERLSKSARVPPARRNSQLAWHVMNLIAEEM
ncbi:hypothetical protein BJI67_15835 (plasmid) [Acidihalobacter aeolianus]|uniref:ATP-dependent RecD-like DNA helicase n=1 Tax=Acidihalobacter aeolianus TaxID=2792603 RepID=A0A1D8KCL9_9GAMM|nr:ATP-dependent RecD-like DNA helicase [Acidihalobacter aeolianus]AOV18714.1 hypothetical protein BJI67_15835 [Acidihalobacter aeolianus]